MAVSAGRVLKVLKDDGFAETRLVEADGRLWLEKTYRFRFWWGRAFDWLARRFVAHEMENARRLEGIEGIPGLTERVSENAFRREWIAGEDLKARKRDGRPVSDAFFGQLADLLRAVHARGVAYNDLAKFDNVIVREDGRPALIDFQVSLRAYEGPSRPLRAISAWLIRRLQREDWRHVYKHKRKLRPDQLTDEERAVLAYRSPIVWPHYAFRRVALPIKRLFYPKGSNETFRFSRKPPKHKRSA